MPRRPRVEPASIRIRNLLALDAAVLMRRLDDRRDEMIGLFSRLRDRAPMLSTIESRYGSATFHDLAMLGSREQAAVSAFHERLDALRWYFTYTEDMPSTAQLTLTSLHRQLEEAHRDLVHALGPPASPNPPPVVVTEVIRRDGPDTQALAPVRTPRRRRRARRS